MRCEPIGAHRIDKIARQVNCPGSARGIGRGVDATLAVGNTPQALGGLLESFVVGELQRALPMQDADYRLYHWRSADRREIDILIDGGSHLVNIEIKSAASVCDTDFKHLKWFATDGPGRNRTCTGIVFYLGREMLTFGNRTFALPVSSLWSSIDA